MYHLNEISFNVFINFNFFTKYLRLLFRPSRNYIEIK